MSGLTTHALDLLTGGPAAGLRVVFYAEVDSSYRLRMSVTTNAEGRTDAALLEAEAMAVGRYQLVFHMGDYFAAKGVTLPSPRFFDQAIVRFAIADARQHYHVPILMAPWGYTTYRGT